MDSVSDNLQTHSDQKLCFIWLGGSISGVLEQKRESTCSQEEGPLWNNQVSTDYLAKFQFSMIRVALSVDLV